jgi:hypothetical protein
VVYVVVSTPPATEETGAIGREIEFRVLSVLKLKKDPRTGLKNAEINWHFLVHYSSLKMR